MDFSYPLGMTATADPTDSGLAIYVHWPFCPSKCPYCDFNSHVREDVPETAWRDALLQDLDHAAHLTPGRTVTSVFFGGGTPSLMAPNTVADIIMAVQAKWRRDPGWEVTLEANPGTLDTGRFRGFRDAGVNRLSIGVQSFDDAALTFLGRIHDAATARQAIDIAASVFDRYSFDLIYARPGQTVPAWEAELADAISLAGDHLSVYQLTIEPGTAFHTAHRLGELVLPDDDTAADLFEATQAQLAAAGLPAYEISNHARPGGESRHNLTYWRYGDYVGVGPGAHGRLSLNGDPAQRLATRQVRLPEAWLRAVAEHGHGVEESVAIDPGTAAEEALLMGLRLTEGVALAHLNALAGRPLEALLDTDRMKDLEAAGLLARTNGHLAATADGRQRLNAVLAELMA